MPIKKTTPEKKQHPIKTYLITGVLVTAPVGITLYLAIKLIGWIDQSVTGILPLQFGGYENFNIPGLGIVVLFVFLVIVGMMTTNFLGRALVGLWTKLINRMPFVSGIYNGLRKVFETLLSPDKSRAFRQPVLVEYPRRDAWTIAFITAQTYSGIQKYSKKKLVCIYVPTTPNPTSGFILWVPEKDIIKLSMPVEDAFKMVISMGIVTPVSHLSGGRKLIETRVNKLMIEAKKK